MTTKNDVTGDFIKSRNSSENYRNNYQRIFGNKNNESSNKTEYDKLRAAMVEKFGESPVTDEMIDFIQQWKPWNAR